MTFSIRRALGALSAGGGRAILASSCLVLAASAFLALASEAEAKMRQFREGVVALDLGDAFTEAENFSGYVDKSTGASFAVIELPAKAYEKLKTIPATPESLANEGFSGTEQAELKGREGPFIYLVGKQKTPAGDVTKFVLIFTQRDTAALIVANVPQTAIDQGKYSREGIEAILAGATVREPYDPDQVFRFTYLGPFKEAFDHGGMTKAFNVSGAKPHQGENRLVKEPMLMVSSSLHGDAIDVKTEADKAFNELGGMKDRQIESSKEISLGNFKGYQITGKVTDEASGDRIGIHVMVLSGEPIGYFMFIGTAPVAETEKMMPEIEKVIASFELVK